MLFRSVNSINLSIREAGWRVAVPSCIRRRVPVASRLVTTAMSAPGQGLPSHDNRARQVYPRKQPPRSSGLAAESGHFRTNAVQRARQQGEPQFPFFRFSQNCSPIAPTPDQSSILRSARSCATSKPKSLDAQIVPKVSCRYPSVGSSNVRSLG